MIPIFKRFKVIFEEKDPVKHQLGKLPATEQSAVSFHPTSLVSSKYSSGKSSRNNIFKEGLNTLT